MELEQTTDTPDKEDIFANLKKETPVSKYLALLLFILLPFLGGWIGYVYAPEKVVEVEKITTREVDRIQHISAIPEGTTEFSSVYIKNWHAPEYKFLVRDGVLNVFTSLRTGPSVRQLSFPNADIDTLEYIGAGYAKDKKAVYYFGSTSFGDYDGHRILDADPETFHLFYMSDSDKSDIKADSARYPGVLGMDQDSVFFEVTKLVGIDPASMHIRHTKEECFVPSTYIYDADTIWYDSGKSPVYLKGEVEEMKDWSQACLYE